jgi:hypothetical protein
VAQVGLVEVIDVEDEHPVAGHVGTEVLRVQIPLDPDAAGALISPTVLLTFHVRVEQARAATIEGERSCGHLPELLAKRLGVSDHKLGESIHQHVDDLRLTLFGGLALPSQVHSSGHEAPFTVGRYLLIVITVRPPCTTFLLRRRGALDIHRCGCHILYSQRPIPDTFVWDIVALGISAAR